MRVPNAAIKPVTEPITVEDVKFRLNGATVFSVLDMNEGYHQLELDPESRHVTTFYGSATKLRYTGLNFGTISAQDIFDKAMDDTIKGLPVVLHIRDDFRVYEKPDENNDAERNHNIALEKLFQAFRDNNLTPSLQKSRFKLPKVEFYGLVFSANGIRPASIKIEALQEMQAPKDVSEVKSVLGMAQYSAQSIRNFAEITTPL